MAIDAKTWLLEQGYDDASATEMAARLSANPTALANIENSTLRQADYSREQAKLQKAQDDLNTANDRLTAEMADWAAAQAQGRDLTAKQQRDLEAAQAKVAMLTTRVTNIATQSGIDPKVALEGLETVVTTPTPTPTPTPGFDANAFVTEQNQRYAQMTQLMVTLPGEMFNLATEHQQLYGKPLDTAAVSKEILTRANTRGNQKSLDPRQVWEEMHGVPAQREKIRTDKYDADIKAAEARGEERARSEAVIPGQPTPQGRHSIVLTGERKSALNRPQPMSTVSAAAAAFRTGKYKNGSGKTT